MDDVPRYYNVFLIVTRDMDDLLFLFQLYKSGASGALRKTTCLFRAFLVGYGKTLIA